MARTRIRGAVAIWAVVTEAWLGTLAMAGLCEPRRDWRRGSGRV